MNPIIPWIGGKRRLADEIFPLFPEHKCYVEAFSGAAALYFMKEPSEVEVINDINGELINLYRVVKCHLEEFVRQFKYALTSREVYKWHQNTPPETLTDIQRAARFFYLQKLAFGGIEEDLSAAHLRLSQTYVKNLPWDKVIEKYDRPHTLHYCDHPYWETEGYGVDFGLEQYERMAELAKTVAGAMVISVGDHPEMRRTHEGLHMKSLAINYTVGGGKGAAAQELLIWNENTHAGRRSQGTLDLF